jgi:hypothetical protein
MKRKVKLIAVDNRYKETAYPYQCVFDEALKTYRTGQHIDNSDPKTRDNLTVEEMTGEVQLSEEKRKRFPYVINPLPQINFYNNQEFDLSTDESGKHLNPRDAALVNLLKKHGYMVAVTREEVIPKRHMFYIKDDIYEAEQRVSKSDKAYQAEKYIREELKGDGLRDVGMVLAYKVKDFRYNPDTESDLMLKDKIIELCKTKPEKVLECKQPGTNDDIYVLKLSLHNFITRRGTDFYDGSKFIGKDLDDVKKFMNLEENTALVSKWNRLLAEKEGRVTDTTQYKGTEKEEMYEKIKDKTMPNLRRYAGLKQFPKDEWDSISSEEEMIKYMLSKV